MRAGAAKAPTAAAAATLIAAAAPPPMGSGHASLSMHARAVAPARAATLPGAGPSYHPSLLPCLDTPTRALRRRDDAGGRDACAGPRRTCADPRGKYGEKKNALHCAGMSRGELAIQPREEGAVSGVYFVWVTARCEKHCC